MSNRNPHAPPDPEGVALARAHLPPGYELDLGRESVVLRSPFGWSKRFGSPWQVVDILGSRRRWIRTRTAEAIHRDAPRMPSVAGLERLAFAARGSNLPTV